MADLLIELGEYSKAIPYVKQASELSKDEPRTLLLRLRVAFTLEGRTDALSTFESEKDGLNHLSSDLIAFICKLYWFEGKKSQAIEYFLIGLQRQSVNFHHFLEIYFPESYEIADFCDIIDLFDDEF